jgi:hypothetical protein
VNPGHARLEIRVCHGDQIVQRFERTTIASTGNIQRIAAAGEAWLQCWSGQLSDRQWQADIDRARRTA